MPRIKIEWTDDLLAQLVELAQRDDITWEQIGEKLGVNGEAARSKYRRLIAKGDIDPIDQPTPQEMFRYLRDHPRTLAEICNKYDKPPRVIRAKLIDMEQEGYVVIERRESILVPTSYRPQAKAPDISIADMMGQKFTIGVGGDLHGGSEWTQPTSYNKFVLDAYHNHGVRHFFDPGDKFAGIYGYRGHDVDLIPAARPLSYKLAHHATRRQIEIANIYTPQLEGVTYYQLGGNHDFWHVVHTGIDAVRVLCDQRDDMIYLGYDVCGVPLTDKTHLKLWHPTGGAGYSKCLSDDTEILTKRGWVGHETINMSDEVATLNSETSELQYQRPIELFVEEYQGKMIHIKSRTVDHLVTPNHDLWIRPYPETYGDRPWRKEEASNVLSSHRQQWQMNMKAEWIGNELDTYRIPFREWPGAIDLGDIPVDSFLRFLGWYVSEGNLRKGDRKEAKGLEIHQKEGPRASEIKTCMEAIGLNVRIYPKTNAPSILTMTSYNTNLARWLDEHVGSGAKNKRVPRFIMNLSPRQIGIFLDALWAGDGHWQTKNKRWDQYTSVSSQLLGDVQELLLKVGYAATFNGIHLGCLTQNTPTINEVPNSVDYTGKIWCVRVPNGLIYARRNGKPIWTGNSYKMQRKGQEPTAMIALREAIRQEESPKVSIILMGHLHISLFLPTAPIYGIATGCFEAQSNFMKRLGLIPDVGGTILEFEIGDDGRIKSINYKWRSFHEIDKDWQNWPIPEVKELDFSPDNLDTLVEVSKAPESFQEQ